MKIGSDISFVKSIPNHRINDVQPSNPEIQNKKNTLPAFDQDAYKLSESEKKLIQKLKQRDRDVRTHEQQHKAVAGRYARGMSFSYQTGPDGRQYAIGGQVQLDTSPIPDDPEATIEKMKQIKRAALAPSQPSSTDRRVASESDREIMRQQVELRKEKGEEAIEAYQQFETEESQTVNIYF